MTSCSRDALEEVVVRSARAIRFLRGVVEFVVVGVRILLCMHSIFCSSVCNIRFTPFSVLWAVVTFFSGT